MTPGDHRLRLQKGSRRVETGVAVMASQQVDVRFTLSPTMVLVKRMNTVMLWVGCQGGAPGMTDRLAQSAIAALRSKHVAPMKAGPAGAECPDALQCQLEVGRRAGAQFTLDVRVEAEGQGIRIAANLYDVVVGAAAATAEARCEGCSEDEAAQRLTKLVTQLVSESVVRPRGTLRISGSQGALVKVDGRQVGTIPYECEVFAGSHVVRVERAGYSGVDPKNWTRG